MRYKFLMFITTVITFCFFLGSWFSIILLLNWSFRFGSSDWSKTLPQILPLPMAGAANLWWERFFFFLAFLVFILIAYWGSCAPVKLYRGGTGLACRSIKDGGWDGGESQDLLVKTYVLQIAMNDNKPVNQGSQKLKYKRKREGEVYTGSKQLRSEGFSWWTSLLLGTDCTVQRDSTLPRLSTAECELKQPENSLCTEGN